MKTKLLVLCLAFPFLSNAQNEVKNGADANQFFLNWESQQTMFRSGVSELPDSVYTYYVYEGGIYDILMQRAAFTYDDRGRVVLEEGWKDVDWKDSIQYKKDHTYTLEPGGLDKQQVIESHFIDGKWREMNQTMIYSHSDNPASTQMIVEAKQYSMNGLSNKWELEKSRTTVEFNEKGYPVVMQDSNLMVINWVDLQRIELSYNENNQIDTMVLYLPDEADENKWIIYSKTGHSYNSDGKLTNRKTHFIKNDGWSEWTYETKYGYDEKGNLTSMIERNDDLMHPEYYKNFYSSTVSNEVLDPVKLSNVYTDPAGSIVVIINDVEDAIVSIYNISGHLIRKQTVSSPQTFIPASNLSKGVCIVKIETAKGSDTYKVFIK